MKYLVPILFLGIFLSSCKEESQILSYEDQLAIDLEIIQDYLDSNNLTAQEGEFGLYYIIEEPGTGTSMPTATSSVIMTYKGFFPDGQVFDQNDKVEFGLQNTISGWQVGVPLFKKGGKGKLLIPSSLAYGVGGRGGIPGNQVLIFDIELHNFN